MKYTGVINLFTQNRSTVLAEVYFENKPAPEASWLINDIRNELKTNLSETAFSTLVG
jgi:hypothetical protein